MRTLLPTQIGTVPSGSNASYPSQIQVGRIIASNDGNFGFGAGGRPDFVEKFKICLTQNSSTDKTINTNLIDYATISIDVSDLVTIVAANSNAAAALNFTLKQVDVCEGGVAKKMMILASPTYL